MVQRANRCRTAKRAGALPADRLPTNLDIADKTFFRRMIPSFRDAGSKSVLKMPKGQLRDSCIHLLTGVDS